MFCEKCGKEMDAGQKFCMYCGNKVEEYTQPRMHNSQKVAEAPLNAQPTRQIPPYTQNVQQTQPYAHTVQNPVTETEKKKSSKLPIIIVSIVMVVILAVGAAVAFFVLNKEDKKSDSANRKKEEVTQGVDDEDKWSGYDDVIGTTAVHEEIATYPADEYVTTPEVEETTAAEEVTFPDEFTEPAEILVPTTSYYEEEPQLPSAESVDIGDTYIFGSYEQDNNTYNGKEEIEWIVVDKQGSRVLLVSRYALDCQKYNVVKTDITWEDATLRRWLNGTFINTAFTDAEINKICDTYVETKDNPYFDTVGGNDTTDKVFILDLVDAMYYFPTDSSRKCVPTAYAVANGAYEDDNGCCWWWIRTPGDTQDCAYFVYASGTFSEYGYFVDDPDYAVRPAMWIELE